MDPRHDHIPHPLPNPPQWLRLQLLAISIARHAIPLLPLYFLHGTITAYVLLTAFDLSLGLMLIVATTRDRNDPTAVDPRSRLLMARLVAILLITILLAASAAFISVPMVVPAIVFGVFEGVDWRTLLSNSGFWIPVAAMSLLAAVKAQKAFEATTIPGAIGLPTRDAPVVGNLEQDRKNSLAANAAQVTLIGTFALLCYALTAFGLFGSRVLPVLYAIILVFYDMRPDLGQKIFPDLWKKK
ncbi:MAG: hypothetical protein K8R69_02580 [Deltaproteobacteria bacterium]|nr:hypothetical protein [Deltaproteobacteria bacterium]